MDDEISPAQVWKWVWITAAGAAVVITATIWIATATSGVRGKAGVTRQNNDSTNQVSAQAEFNRVYQDIQRDVAGIKLARDDDHRATVRQVCAADVATYNADAADTTMRDWRPDNLPASIDANQECGIG